MEEFINVSNHWPLVSAVHTLDAAYCMFYIYNDYTHTKCLLNQAEQFNLPHCCK